MNEGGKFDNYPIHPLEREKSNITVSIGNQVFSLGWIITLDNRG